MSDQEWTLRTHVVTQSKGEGMSAETPTPHAAPTGAGTGTGGHVSHLPHLSPGLLLSGIIVVLLLGYVIRHNRGRNREAKRISKAVAQGIGKQGKQNDDAATKVLTGILGMFWRFFTGREMSGKAASNAGFLRPGRRPLAVTLRQMPPAAELGVIALPEPATPALSAGPGAAVERWRGWVAEHPLPAALDAPVRRGGSVAVWIGGGGVQALRGVASAAGGTSRILSAWGTWPYACRLLARLAVLAALFGLWRHPFDTELASTGLLLAVVLASATGPAGLKLWHGPPPDDGRIYGPALWAAVRVVLGQPDEEYMDQYLHLDPDLSRDDAKIRLALPVHFAGTELDRQQLDHLVNTRVPGDWVSRFYLMRGTHFAIWTHKPKPKPKPTPPEMVDFFDPRIQDAVRSCTKGEIVVGIDADGNVVIRELDNETAHWVASIGSGGGKSSFLQCIIAQLVRQGFTIVGVDVKMASLACYVDVPGIHIYSDPRNVVDMREAIGWCKEEVQARNYIASKRPDVEFPGLCLVLEESNEFADVSKEWWTDNKEKGDLAADPVWGDVASFMRLGRHVHGNLVAVFQDLRDQATGGKGLANLFRRFIMGSFRVQQWDRIVGTKPIPESEDKAGRVIMVEGKNHVALQIPYATPERYRAYALAEREQQGYSHEHSGLYGQPPEHSPEVVPALLQGTRHVTELEPQDRPPAGPRSEETAGGGVTSRRRDATRDRLVPGQRDAVGEASPDSDGGGRHRRADEPQDAMASWRRDVTDAAPGAVVDEVEELLSLAEISRRLEEQGIDLKADRIRQAKARDKRAGQNRFPRGTEVNGKTLYTVAEIVEFFPEIGLESVSESIEE